MISSITIRRFKQLQEITIPLSQLTLLVGANNSGKSSILQAVHFAVSLSQSAKLAGGVSWRQQTYELSLNPTQLLYTPIADVMALATGGRLAEANLQQQVEIVLVDSAGDTCSVSISRGRNRNVAISINGRSLGEKLQDLTNPYSVYAPGLAGVPKEELYMSAGRVQRIVARGDANLVLRNVLRMLKQSDEKWERFQDDLQVIFPGVSIDVAFNDLTDEYIHTTFSKDGGPKLPLDAAGTSLLQATQILSYVALFKPEILILDEPDSHLHPNNQRRFCKLISEIATKHSFQILLSTHSRHMLDALQNSSSLVWINNGKIVEQVDSEVTSILLDLGALDSVDYFAHGQLRYLVMTEDTDTSMLEVLLWSSGFSKDDTEVVSYSGCSKTEAATVLGAFVRSKASNLRVIIHRDRDYMDESEIARYCDQLKDHGLHPFVTDHSDIENYFLNSSHISECNPAISIERAQELVDQAIEESKESTIAKIINLRTSVAAKKRTTSGQQIDHGSIALQARRDVEATPKEMARGKIVFGKLKSLVQTELSRNPIFVAESKHIKISSLSSIIDATESIESDNLTI